MLMAAGLGTRLRPYTDAVAKPLLPLMGVPMAQFGLDLLKRAGVTRIVANVHHLAQHTGQALRFLEGPEEWIISDESQQLLGSAGGMAKALPHFENQPFFYVNGDVLCHVNLKDLAQHHAYLRHEFGVRLTLTVYASAPGTGKYREIIFDRKTNLMRRLGEFHQNRAFFASVAVIEPEAVAGLPTDQPSDFVEKILLPSVQMGKVGIYFIDNTLEPEPSSWFDIGDASLWHATHLALIRLMETDEIPTVWRERIQKNNHMLAPGIWVSKRAGLDRAPSGWSGPCYWAPDGTDTSPPVTMEPGTVLYGAPPAGWVPRSGIGYRGMWTNL